MHGLYAWVLPLVMSCSQLDTFNEGTPNLGIKCVHAWGLKSLWVIYLLWVGDMGTREGYNDFSIPGQDLII